MIFREWRSYILLRVRRGMMRAGAWAGATAAAVSVSWFGVHRVLGDSSVKLPRALVVPVSVPPTQPAPPPPTSIGTAVQSPSASATATATAPASPPAGPSPSGTPSSRPRPVTAASSPSGQVTSFVRPGGLIVVLMGATSASLITATPDPGWKVQSWKGTDWLRVDFQQGTQESIFYVTWNGHPPTVQV
jgi:hypothetical protein